MPFPHFTPPLPCFILLILQISVLLVFLFLPWLPGSSNAELRSSYSKSLRPYIMCVCVCVFSNPISLICLAFLTIHFLCLFFFGA